jgi:putative membrane protein
MNRAGLWAYAAALVALLAGSGIGAYETGTWAMEVGPIFIVLPLMVATHRRFPLTPLLYGLIALHMAVLMVGGHYTYARVPLGFWMEDAFGFTRNHYDRIGHLMQGFVPAIAAREILLRRTTLAAPSMRGGWLFMLVTAICLAISALYELIEWGVAEAMGASSEDFLGTQGDPFDTQKDMFCAWLGAMAAQWLLGRWHDRQIATLRARSSAT